MTLNNRQLHMMGTVIELSLDHTRSETILDRTEALLDEFNRRFSANDPKSNLMTINRNSGIRPVQVEQDLFDLIEIGRSYSIYSESRLNIAIGPLIKLWRIGFDDAQVPNQDEINQVLSLVDPKNIELDDDKTTVYLNKVGMEIDLGALAKGYFADKIKELWLSLGVESGLINLGGNVLAVGKSTNQTDGNWRIGIQHPQSDRGGLVAALPVRDQSVVTSGIYERALTVDGETYHHIFNSQTGYPIENNTASITIVADESLQCEIWTTILFTYKPEEAIQMINKLDDREGIIMTRDNKMYVSDGLTKTIELAK